MVGRARSSRSSPTLRPPPVAFAGGGEHLETAFQYRVFLDTMFHKFLIVFRNATSQPQYHLR